MTNYVKHFRELKVYQKQREISREVFRLSRQFPAEEKFSLTDQIRRSSRSVGAQIAEAWGKRRYPKHFTSKLTDADGEQLETQHWLIEAKDCGYLAEEDFQRLTGWCEELGRMLGAMIQKADSFAGSQDRLREESIPYFTE
ncbi:MAG: four helix bundle protein [Verrucomicrobiae bacterium]|nr:four helix bundle protein [Verrucomicrobiae bacterium]